MNSGLKMHGSTDFFSIRKKLILIFLVIIMVSVLVSTSVGMWFSLQRLEDGLQEDSRRAMHDLKGVLMLYETRSENIAELLAQSSEIKRFDHPGEVQDFLDAKRDLWYTAIVEVFNPAGKRIAKSCTDSESCNAYMTAPDDPLLARGLELEKVSDYFFYPHGLALKSMEPIVDMATLRPVGVVVVTYPFNARQMQAFKERIKSEVVLQWDGSGDIVSSIQESQGRSLTRIWNVARTDFRASSDNIQTFSGEMIAGKPYTTSYEVLRNQFGSVIGMFTTLVDEQVLVQNKKDTSRILLIAAFLIFIIAQFVGYVMAKTISRPILGLSRVAKGFSEGQWDQPLPVDRSDEIGVLARGFAHMRDAIKSQINQLQSMNQAILKAEEKYRSIFENAIEGIFQMTPVGKIVTINPSGLRILGFASLEDLLKTDRTLQQFFVSPEDAQTLKDFLDSSGLVRYFETQFYRADGTIFYGSITAHALLNEDSSVRYIEGNIQNITEKKRVEEYKRAKIVAESANQAKSDFLAFMSHELRTPLNAILGFTHVLKHDKVIVAQEGESLDIIERSGQHLLMLVNQILNLSAIDAGRVSMVETVFDLYALLDEIRAMLRLGAAEKGVELLCEYAPGVPRFIRSDQMKVRQVLINLVNNALKFTEKGSVNLRVETVHGDGASQDCPAGMIRLFFEVTDTGIGMQPDEIGTIFEPFEQTVAGLGKKEGTGLGLTISDKYIQLLGGKIIVASNKGAGSRFFFDIAVGVVGSDSISALDLESSERISDVHGSTEPMAAGEIAPDVSSWQSGVWKLAPGVRHGLKEALQRADIACINAMLVDVKAADSRLGAQLQHLADQFEYGVLLTMLENENRGE